MNQIYASGVGARQQRIALVGQVGLLTRVRTVDVRVLPRTLVQKFVRAENETTLQFQDYRIPTSRAYQT